MNLNYKNFLLQITIVFLLPAISFAQLSLPNSFNTYDSKYVIQSSGNGLQIGYSTNSTLRHSTLMYNPVKMNGLSVISVHEPGTGFDRVYYVDDSGTTQYRSLSNTGPLNLSTSFGQTQYDSFNPHGSEDFYQGVVNGIANLFLSKSFSLKR